MIGTFICWLIRLFGGNHTEKKTRRQATPEHVSAGHAFSYMYVCERCGNERAPESHKRKVKVPAA